MNIPRLSLGFAVAAMLGAGPALAQQGTVAKLEDLTGDVLVSQGEAMVAGSNGQRVAVGTRVVTTAGSQVTINYDFGCDVRLNENQRFTVNLGACAALLAGVESLGPAAGAIGGGTAVASGAGLTLGGAGVGLGVTALSAGLYVGLRDSAPVSPN
jgi:hypothetical protein